jgi:autotransporter-associated beta strand protein
VNGDGIGGPNADVVNIVYDNQIADTVPITVNRSGKLNFGSSTDTVGNLTIKDSELITVNKHGTVNMNGYSDEVGALNLNGGTIAIGATGTLIVGGPNTFTGPTTISTGVLQLAGGSMPGPLTIGSGATLTGSGSTGPLTFTSGSDFTANVNTLGSNMVSATGPINLNGATLNAVLGTLPALNQTFTFLSSTTAIDGTFAGLANNQTFVAGGHTFRITHGAFNTVFLTFLG